MRCEARSHSACERHLPKATTSSNQPHPKELAFGSEARMFLFFSNGLGLIGSIVVSVIVTLVLLKACAM